MWWGLRSLDQKDGGWGAVVPIGAGGEAVTGLGYDCSAEILCKRKADVGATSGTRAVRGKSASADSKSLLGLCRSQQEQENVGVMDNRMRSGFPRPIIGVTLLIASIASVSAQPPTASRPKWLHHLISRLQAEPVRNPPATIVYYRHAGQPYYYLPPQCCDQFSTLYNGRGKVVCAPDGGHSGKGDGKCPPFVYKMLQARNLGRVIWKDRRNEAMPSEGPKSEP
jgi:hypothetical protein